ncbi:tRNA (adenosine(37)-N6)-threonylcarbamoyltransferase complex dimerization subunit type 1 TsaB [Anaerovibrio sp.]|uniref:tRNA (adenosine(37)-N6)-threonylcarbamoyltransferase complex dimerization subunit type 1 TsaB n=1 Tax=Anaerovibrio sp. TaxID=1872532 RepID=UPI003F150043
MPILAIDTATMVSSVAVADKDRLLAELTVQTRLTHSETLLPHVEQVMQMAGTERAALTGVAVSLGPGSFTGLRIGLAAAKAIAYGLGIPIWGIPTTEALAWHYPVPGVAVVPFIDAQKGNVYSAVYQWQGNGFAEISPVQVYTMEEALELCAAQPVHVLAVGDMAARKLAGRDDLPSNVQVPPPHVVMPRAANVAMAGLKRQAAGQADSVMNLEPVYIRRSEAEVLWEKRQAAGQAQKQVQP